MQYYMQYTKRWAISGTVEAFLFESGAAGCNLQLYAGAYHHKVQSALLGFKS